MYGLGEIRIGIAVMGINAIVRGLGIYLSIHEARSFKKLFPAKYLHMDGSCNEK